MSNRTANAHSLVLPAALLLLTTAALALLAASASATPTTHWDGPAAPDNGTGALTADLAMNSRGNGAAVWFTGNQTWAALYSPGSWGEPVRLNVDRTDGYQVVAPEVAIDESGNAAAAWQLMYQDQWGSVWGEAYAATYTPASGWSAEHLLGPEDMTVGDTPALAFGPGGRLFVTYLDAWDLANPSETVAIYDPGSGWASNYTLGTRSGTWMPAFAQVVADASAAVVVWDLMDVNNYTSAEVWASTYLPGAGWSAPHRLDRGYGQASIYTGTMRNGVATFALLDMDALGMRSVGLYTWSAAQGWSAGETVAGPLPLLGGVRLSADSGGNVTLLYTNITGPYTYDLWGRYFSANDGWQAPTPLEGLFGRVNSAAVAPDRNGGALAVFTFSNNTTLSVFWTRYLPGVGWKAEQVVHVPVGFTAGVSIVSSPELALAVWPEQTLSGWHLQAFALARDDEAPTITVEGPDPTLVNTSTVAFRGTADPLAASFVDGVPLPVTPGGRWAFNETLSDGAYARAFDAVDEEGNTFHGVFTFTVDTVSQINLTKPEALYTETDAAFGAIGGTAEPGSLVWINGLTMQVGANGSFQYVAILALTVNRFEVVAVDLAGNRGNLTVDIRQVLPDSGIDEARAEIANLSANLTAALGDLSAAQADVAALEANASASQGEVAAARARLTLAESNVTALSAQLTLANASLTKAQADAAKAQADAAAASARADAAQSAAGGANMLAVVGVALGAAGLAVGLLGMMRARQSPGSRAMKTEEPPKPPT